MGLSLGRALIVFGALIVPHTAFPQISAGPKSSVIQNSRGGVVKIERKCSSGSGFFMVNEGLLFVITNEHVVRATPECPTDPIAVQSKIGNQRYPASVFHIDTELDIAVLKPFVGNADTDSLARVNPLMFHRNAAKKGQQILVWGSPYGEGIVPLDGLVNNVFGAFSHDVVEVNVSAQPGNSGGPILDKATGQVLAVMNSRAQDKSGAEGVSTGRAFGTSAEDVKKMLASLDWNKFRELPPPAGHTPSEPRSAPPLDPRGATPPESAPSAPTPPMVEEETIPFSLGPLLFQTLSHAALLLPAMFIVLTTLWMFGLGEWGFGSVLLLLAPLLHFLGLWAYDGIAFAVMPAAIGIGLSILCALVGVLVVAHLGARVLLFLFILSSRSDATETRTVRTGLSWIFRPRVAIPLSTVLLTGGWAYWSFWMIWEPLK